MNLIAAFNELYLTDTPAGNLIANFQRIREPLNLLDIALLAVFVFVLLSQLAKSPVRSLLNGLLLFLVLLAAVTAFEALTALNWFIRNSYLVILVSIPIIFQHEIRELLSDIGEGADVGKRLFRQRVREKGDLRFIDELVHTVRHLQDRKLGALIVLRGQERLASTLNEGTRVGARCIAPLLSLIFEKQSLIHDGAVIIDDGRIQRANVLFQLQEDTAPGRPGPMTGAGTRHMAASAITRRNDALCVVVSEETGEVALSRRGQLTVMDPDRLHTELYSILGH